ncbi:MAG: glycosyl transferase family 2 [endosymbiont of Escarpia spicata]|uniref:Glycosyl transferase family 2 n=1 Tax=endosymbiont of Escarpia spicata TaxID=2200908 RepID=A0A370DQZ8_9GAMM|nr:MAG: glycosyl transferase family 2 [endosymbiont of Escarpia spicata]
MISPHPSDKQPSLCVIIPTLNEGRQLPSLLNQLLEQEAIDLEIIVADGGSDDDTVALAARTGAKVAETTPGRGRQMNGALSQCNAPYLLFLHADSELTSRSQLSDALKRLQQQIAAAGHQRIAGHFRLRFLRDNPGRNLTYRYYEEKSALNRMECTNGDQGFLMSQDFFNQLGGFDESLWFLEDQRLAETIRLQGCWITLPGELQTSARRFEKEGLGRRMILSALIMNFHQIGFIEFFQRAGKVYRNQNETGPLQLSPIFQLIDSLNRGAKPGVARKRWVATGHYVLGHAWQPFFYLDTALLYFFGFKKRPFLTLHDRIFKPLTRFVLFDYLTAGLVWLWFRTSWLFFRYREKA